MILDNPFHILGLPADCTAKERSDRTSRARAMIHSGMPLEFGVDDLCFSGCRRNATTVEQAIGALHSEDDRLLYGLFWFTRSGILDGVALPHLRQQAMKEAFGTWAPAENRTPTPKYVSSLSNFGTLCLLLGTTPRSAWFADESDRMNMVQRGLRAKVRIFDGLLSDRDLGAYCNTFSAGSATRGMDRIVREFGRGLEGFADEVRRYGVPITNSTFIQVFEGGGARTAVLRARYEKAATHLVENELKKCALIVADDVAKAGQAGTALMRVAGKELGRIKSVVGGNDATYTSLADRVADVLLDASVAHYNHNVNVDASVKARVTEESLGLVRCALDIACGLALRKRAERNLAVLEENKASDRKRYEVERIAGDVSAWMVRSSKMLQDDTASDRQIEIVRKALTQTASGVAPREGAVLVMLESFLVSGTRAFGQDFRGNEGAVQLGSAVCNILLAHAVAVANRANKVDRWHAAKLIVHIGKRFTDASRPKKGRIVVDDECHAHLVKNVGRARQHLRNKLSPRVEMWRDRLGAAIWILFIGAMVWAWLTGKFDEDPEIRMEMPPTGTNSVFSLPQIRWCVREYQTIEARRRALPTGSASEVDEYNAAVGRYNAHCGSNQYRPRDLERARRELREGLLR